MSPISPKKKNASASIRHTRYGRNTQKKISLRLKALETSIMTSPPVRLEHCHIQDTITGKKNIQFHLSTIHRRMEKSSDVPAVMLRSSLTSKFRDILHKKEFAGFSLIYTHKTKNEPETHIQPHLSTPFTLRASVAIVLIVLRMK